MGKHATPQTHPDQPFSPGSLKFFRELNIALLISCNDRLRNCDLECNYTPGLELQACSTVLQGSTGLAKKTSAPRTLPTL